MQRTTTRSTSRLIATSKLVSRGAIAAGTLVAVVGSGASIAAATPSHHRPGIAARLGRPAVAGTVTTAPTTGGSSFVITTRGSTAITVDVTTTTTFEERGVTGPALTDVTSGDLVAVFGSLTGAAVAASEVSIFTPATGHGDAPATAGTVTTAPTTGGSSFVITTRGGTAITVNVSSTTTYIERGVTGALLGNVVLDAKVAVFGTISGATATATEIAIHPTGGRDNPVLGTVATTPAANSFTITTPGGSTFTVDVTGATTYVERGVGAPTLSNVGTTDRVAVFGITVGSTVNATEVVIVPPPAILSNFATAGTVATAPVSGGTSFTITTWGGSAVTVVVTSTTTYTEFGNSAPTLNNVTAGEFVGVFGTASGATVTATQVQIAGNRSAGLFDRQGAPGQGVPDGHQGRFGAAGLSGPSGASTTAGSTGPGGQSTTSGQSDQSEGSSGFGGEKSGFSPGGQGLGGHR